jgi:hypothetical protein
VVADVRLNAAGAHRKTVIPPNQVEAGIMRNSVALALAGFLVASSLSAQGNKIDVCTGKAPFKVASVAGNKMVVSSGASPIDRLRNMCAPQPYDFVSEDSKRLLAGIKLAREQNDSVSAIRRTFTVLQKTVNDQTLALYKANRDSTTYSRTPARAPDAREFFLTDQMKVLREQLTLALRRVATTDQLTRFEANLAEMFKKEGG